MAVDTDLSTPLSQVRAIIGDTEGQFITDQTINALLLTNDDNVQKTAIQCLQFIVADLAKHIDQEVGDVSVEMSQQYDHYKELLDNLLTNPAYMLNAVVHILGGVSCSGTARVYNNPDSRHIDIREGFSTRASAKRINPNNPFYLSKNNCDC